MNESDVGAVTDENAADNTIAENAAQGATVGITALATDADATDTVTYSVNDSRFNIDANGVVTVAAGASFDAETEGSIDLIVTATSSDTSTSQETFTIAVSDVNDEAPVTQNLTVNTSEDQLTSIVLTATDVDSSVASFSVSTLPMNGTLYLDLAMTQEVQVNTDYLASSDQLTLYFKPTDHWAGSNELQFNAKDPDGFESNASIATVNVAAVADKPDLFGPSKIVELVDFSASNGNGQSGVVDITNNVITLNNEDDNEEVSVTEIETGLGLVAGTLDGLANTSSATKVVDGSYFTKDIAVNAGDVLTFDWDFIDPEFNNNQNTTVYNDFAVVVINGVPTVLEEANDNETGISTYTYTVTQTGILSLGFAAVNVGDAIYDSQLVISNIELSGVAVPAESIIIDVNISSALIDTDGSESQVVTLSGFPEGTLFNLGSQVGNDWVIDLGASDLSSLTMTLPVPSADFDLSVASLVTDSNGGTASSAINIPISLLDTSTFVGAQIGLQGDYYGFNRVAIGNNNIDNISDARTVINNQSVDATFTATALDYGSGSGDLARSNHLQEFLKDDASSLSTDPSNNEHGLLHMEGKIYLTAGTYGFQVTADDGYQILINGVSVAEYDANQGTSTRNPDNYSQGHEYFTITDSGAQDIEIIYWDQGGAYRFLAEITDDNGQSYETLDKGYLRSSEVNADQLLGDDTDNELVGLLVDDDIFGQAGDDNIIGNSGNDYMSGGEGSDTFVWLSGDDGSAGSVTTDIISDFQTGNGGDVLNLSDLLVDEESNSLEQYLHFSKEGNDTVVEVSPDRGSVTQKITLEGVDLTTYGDDSAIINQLIADGNLDVDS